MSGGSIQRVADGADGAVHPPYSSPDYRSSRLRAPLEPLIMLPESMHDPSGPVYGEGLVSELDSDLTRQHAGEPLGERIIVTGRVLDSGGRPVPNALIELWQANAAGRYVHQNDQHPAPLDPNFTGAGRCLTDADGDYRFTSVKPGAYPWKNHPNAWRPAHIHFSIFGRAFTDRLVTQMYFPGDPLFADDPIFQSVRDPQARERLVARPRLGHDHSGVGAGLPLRHRARRQRRDTRGGVMASGATPSQTVGPFFSFGLCVSEQNRLVDPGTRAPSSCAVGCSTERDSRYPTPWSRSGSVTPAAGSGWGSAGAGRVPTRPAGTGSSPSNRAGLPRRT